MDYMTRFVKWQDLNPTLSSVFQAYSSLTAIFVAFQNPDVRMAVIRCFKIVTQSHSLIFTTWLEILDSTAHAHSNKKGDFVHLISGRQAGSRSQNIRKLWASLSRWPWPAWWGWLPRTRTCFRNSVELRVLYPWKRTGLWKRVCLQRGQEK